MKNRQITGTREVDGPRIDGDPIRRYYFESLDTKAHWHDDFEILYIRDGEVSYHIGTNDITGKKGDLILVSPYVLHYGNISGKKLSVSIYVFKPEFLCSSNSDMNIKKYFKPIISGEKSLPNIISTKDKCHSLLVECLNKLDKAEEKRKTAFELAVHNELIRFFSILYEYDMINQSQNNHAKGEKSIKKAIAYIDANYNSKLTISKLATICSFSESHFMSLFKQYMGVSCVTYINQIRIAKAVELLKSTDLSVLEISEQTGFNSISLFNRTFKKHLGTTPKSYRKLQIDN